MERLKNCNQMPLTICEYLSILLNHQIFGIMLSFNFDWPYPDVLFTAFTFLKSYLYQFKKRKGCSFSLSITVKQSTL